MTNHKVMPEELEDYQEESLESIQNGKNFLKSLENLPSEKIDSMMNEWDNLENNQEESKMNASGKTPKINPSDYPEGTLFDEKGFPYVPYSMVKEYTGKWDMSSIFKELYANSLDTHTPVIVKIENDTLVISDKGEGEGITPKHLLLGKSFKPDSDSIGQFGEGMKLALMLCNEFNLKASIQSNNFLYWNDHIKIVGEDCLKINYIKTPYHAGTIVKISPWKEGLKYLDLFLKPDDILYANKYGGILKDNLKGLFVKTVFTQANEQYYMSYNLNDVEMVKGRTTLQDWDIKCNIANILYTCEDINIWMKFFEGIESGKNEKDVPIQNYRLTDNARIAMKEGYKKIYGNKVLMTSVNKAIGAQHEGIQVIQSDKFGSYLKESLVSLIGTDESMLIEKRGEFYERISSHHIDDTQKRNLAYLRKIAKRVGFNSKNIKISSLDASNPGKFYFNDKSIEIRIDCLDSLARSVDVFLHELGHWKDYEMHGDTDDNTDNHINAITQIGGLLLASYLDHKI